MVGQSRRCLKVPTATVDGLCFVDPVAMHELFHAHHLGARSRLEASICHCARDARILADYLDSFRSFFGNAAGAVEVYWAFLVWLYAAPAAPYLRQAAVPAGIDPWVYPVYAVLFGRSSGGKTLFTKIAARSMFGFEKMIRSGQFTANRVFGLRERLGSIPLLIDARLEYLNQWNKSRHAKAHRQNQTCGLIHAPRKYHAV